MVMSYQQSYGQHIPSQVIAPLLQPPRKRVTWPWVVVLAALAVGVVVVVAVLLTRGSTGESVSELAKIQQSCGLSTTYSTIGDSGRTITLDGQGKEDAGGISWTEVECVLDGTKMPASVRGQFNSTRALDGMQRASWDGY